MQPGEVIGRGQRGVHAEINAVNAARQMGLTPTSVAPSRPACEECARTLHDLGIRTIGPNLMETFDENQLRKVMERLDPWKRVVFMALTCERMVPNYDRFKADTGFGDSQVLWRGLSAAWDWLEFDQMPDELEGLREKVELQAPDTASFSSPLTSAALDAANAVAILLDSFVEGVDPTEVASLARDTVDMYVQQLEDMDPNDPELEENIKRHPLMQREVRQQRDDLVSLERWTGSKHDGARQLRPRKNGPTSGSLAEVDH